MRETTNFATRENPWRLVPHPASRGAPLPLQGLLQELGARPREAGQEFANEPRACGAATLQIQKSPQLALLQKTSSKLFLRLMFQRNPKRLCQIIYVNCSDLFFVGLLYIVAYSNTWQKTATIDGSFSTYIMLLF